MLSRLGLAVAAMVAVVAASNFLVQFPVEARIGAVDLAEILTWGAFTYPIAFFVNDLTNRRFGPQKARLVVFAGFAVAVVISIWLASPRIAIASGTAFLLAQLLDTAVFHRLRHEAWWKPPFVSGLVGSALDTALFFSIAFAPAFASIDAMTGQGDSSLGFAVPLLSVGMDVPLWVSLALGDFLVKLLIAVLLLVPYRAVLGVIRDRYAPA